MDTEALEMEDHFNDQVCPAGTFLSLFIRTQPNAKAMQFDRKYPHKLANIFIASSVRKHHHSYWFDWYAVYNM